MAKVLPCRASHFRHGHRNPHADIQVSTNRRASALPYKISQGLDEVKENEGKNTADIHKHRDDDRNDLFVDHFSERLNMDEKKDTRGGRRPGAGRPKGVTKPYKAFSVKLLISTLRIAIKNLLVGILDKWINYKLILS